jgi:serine/threonine protein kinase
VTISDGSNLGPFRIIGALGRGGMASVYKAFEPGLDRTVAVKVLPAEYLHDPSFAERFRREAQVIARLEHPHIVPIYAYGIDQGMPWMSMRLVAGGSLYSLLHAGGRLGYGPLLEMLAGVAGALDYAHAAGVVHRDVKPQNILIDEQRHVYLADFGIAKMIEGAPGLTQTGMITGTPQYMAPEQALGSKVDRRADIYSLGIVAYECLTGRVPFTADTPLAVLMKHVRDPIPLPPVSEVPEPQCHVLMKALAKNPADRWPSAAGFVEAMRHAHTSADGGLLPTLVAPTVRSPPRPPRSGRALVQVATATVPRPHSALIVGGLAAAVLIVLALGGYLLLGTGRQTPDSSPQPSAPLQALDAAPQLPTEPPPRARQAEAVPALVRAATPEPALSPPPTAPTPVRARTSTPAAAAAPATPYPEMRAADVAPPLAVTVAAADPPARPAAAASVPDTVAERPSSIGFALNAPIALGDLTQSLVTLRTVTFRFNRKNSELQAEVAGRCDEGKDHAVDVQLTLIDQSGDTIATLKGRGTIEEEDDGKIRAKQHLTQNVVSSVASFRITFQARPD